MYRQIYTGFAIGSTLLGVTGLIQCWKTEGITRTIALTIGIGGSVAALTTVGLGIAYDGKSRIQQNDFEAKINESSRTKKAEVNGLEVEIRRLKSTITTLSTQGTQYLKEIASLNSQLNLKAEQYLLIIADQDLKISQLQGIVSERDTRVADFLEDSRGYVGNFLSLSYQSLDSLQKSLEKAVDNDVVPLARDSFERRIGDIRELKGELLDALNEIKSLEITDFKIVLDFIFKFDNKFLNVKVRWKDFQAKKIKNENTNLRDSLAESMPKAVAIERLQDGLNDFDTRITEKYEALLLNNNSIHAQLLDLLEQRNLVIDDLQRQNEALQKPLLAVGTSDYALAANRIANYYYENYGYKLDVIHWLENDRYEIIWALVDCYQAIFILIQMNWERIKENIRKYIIDEYVSDSCFESEVSLFFEILREHYDGSFQRCVDGWNFTPSHAKNRAVTLRKMVEAIDKSTTLVLASHEERQKLGLPKTMKYFFLLPTVLELARENCRRKPSLTTYYHSCWQALSRVADIHEHWASQHRGRNRARAVKWQKGQFFVGIQGGYAPVTKLNQTFSEPFEKNTTEKQSGQGKQVMKTFK